MRSKKVVIKTAFSIVIPEELMNRSEYGGTEQIGEMIRIALEERGIHTKNTIVTLCCPEAMVRELLTPAVKPKELERRLKEKTDELFLQNNKRYNACYSIKQELFVENQRSYRILVTLCEQETVNYYKEIITAAKLKPVSMDISHNTLTRLAGLYSGAKDTYVVCDLRSNYLMLLLFDEGCRQRSLMKDMGETASPDNALKIIHLTAEALHDIQQSYRPEGSIKLSSIILTGEYSAVRGIQRSLRPEFDVMVSLMSGAEFIRSKESVDVNIYAPALGAFIKENSFPAKSLLR